MTYKTADLCDQYANEVNVCKQAFYSYGKKKSFHGPISTVKVFEDNVLIVEALESIPKGNVLIVDGGGSKYRALLGGNLAEIAVNRELAGIIINGYVRDTVELAQKDIGVLALGTNPMRSDKKGNGELNITVTFGGISLNPDAYVYVDEDGIITSEHALV